VPDKNLDLSQYDAHVIENVLIGRTRARMFEDLSRGKPWNMDMTSGSLKIDGTRYDAQVLGTFSAESGTFLWAWANPGAGQWGPSLILANQLRKRGDAPGNAVFAQQKVSVAWVHPLELSYVCGELSGGHPVYVADAGTTTVLLLVTSIKLKTELVSPAYIPGILLDVQQHVLVDFRPCVERYLQRLNLIVAPEPSASVGVLNDREVIRISWDRGKIGHITMADVPAKRTPQPAVPGRSLRYYLPRSGATADNILPSAQRTLDDPLPVRPHPAKDPKQKTRVFGSITLADQLIFIRQTVLAQANEYAKTNLEKHLGGVLVGTPFETDGRLAVDIIGFIPDTTNQLSSSGFKFTPESWGAIHRTMSMKFPERVLAGWLLTMPRFGVFMSGPTKFVHEGYFGLPYQVHLCIDPVSNSLGFFAWDNGALKSCGFHTVTLNP
jgi:hypothetical protein